MIRIEGLTKRFGRRAGVRELSLHVPEGSVYGLLGHNGAGKSTTLGAVLGQIFPDTGDIHVDGHCVFTRRADALARVGAIFESPAFYDYLSGWRNLRVFCEYSRTVPRQRYDEVIELVGLTGRIGDKVSTYSHGMRQRLALAQALLPDPRILILDEPADGLDPEGIAEMRQMIDRLNTQWGLTILFSSHALAEVERVCTHVAVLRSGRLVHDGPWSGAAVARWVRVRCDREAEAIELLRTSGMAASVHPGALVELNGHAPGAINRFLIERGFDVYELTPMRQTLEEFYLQTAQETELIRKIDQIMDEEDGR